MQKSTKYFIATGAVLAATLVAVVFAVVSSPKETVDPGRGEPVTKSNYTLTTDDKRELKLLSESYLDTAGNYGWDDSILTDKSNLSLSRSTGDVYTVFEGLRHSTPTEAAGKLDELSGNSQFKNRINTMIFDNPFSVSSKFTGATEYPDKIYNYNGYPTVELITPISTQLSFLGQDYNYRDNDGKLIRGGLRYEKMTFKSDLSLTFSKKPGGWMLNGFNQNTHVFLTDKSFTFSDGQFDSTNADPETYTVQTVADDGTLSAPKDNLEHYREAVQNLPGNTDGE